jgi:hypothetical protein
MADHKSGQSHENAPGARVSAVGRQRFLRRVLNAVHVGPLILFGFAGLMTLSMTMSSTGSFPTLGFVFFGILAAVASLAPFVIVGAIGYVLYRSYRQGTARGPAENFAAEDRASGCRRASEEERAAALEMPEIREALAGLETVRRTVARKIARRRRLYLPIGVAAGIIGAAAIWFGGRGGSGSVLIPMAIVFAFGPIVASILANRLPAANGYVRDFKQAILPRLLSRFGDFEYLLSAPPPTLDRLTGTGLLPSHDQGRSDDTVSGSHHGHRLRIDDLELRAWRKKPRGGKSPETVFRGLLVEIEAGTSFAGTTVILQNLPTVDKGRPGKAGLRRIELEDPVFNEIYVVHGDDEVSVRALLTPATMERLLRLVDGQMFLTPGVLAEGGRLFVTFPYLDSAINLFDPHDLTREDAETLLAYQLGDLSNVFSLIDKLLETQTLRFGPMRSRSSI